MAVRKNKLTVAAALAAVLLVACMDSVHAADGAQPAEAAAGEPKGEAAAGEPKAKAAAREGAPKAEAAAGKGEPKAEAAAGEGEGDAKAEAAAGEGKGRGGGEEVSKFCAETSFKETCEKTLANASSANPKDLIKQAFTAASAEVEKSIKNSATFKKLQSDKMTQGALDVCQEVLTRSIEDLKRSFAKVDSVESGKINNNIADLRNWLSATIAHKDTCIDAFAQTPGDTGKKVAEMLTTTGELLSNALAMVTSLQKLLGQVDLVGMASKLFGGAQRQLLGDASDSVPDFVDSHMRKLMAAGPPPAKPDAVVALDGSGQYKTIQSAVDAVPKKNVKPFVILVKAGVYKEYVLIDKGVDNVVLIGEGPLKTIITGSKSYAGGVQTFASGTLRVTGEGFMAKDIKIENTVALSQAVAVRINGDRGVFYNCHIEGFQDTLYSHSYRQLYSNCRITGTIDFIFGDAKAIIQNSEIVVRKPLPKQACMVTAQGRDDIKSDGVLVLQNCNITAEQQFLDAKPPFEAYLGRPWKTYSRTIIMQCNIEGFIQPAGFFPWSGTFALDTLYYAEWDNRGLGADTSKRVTWKGIEKHMTAELALKWTPEKVFVYDDWVKKTGVPYVGGMIQGIKK